jgi:hypothetical protein
MNPFEKTSFNRAINILKALKCQYAVVLPDGTKHGELEVTVKKEEKEYEYGEITGYVEEFVKEMAVGQTLTIHVGKYPIDKVQGACLNWFHKRHGAGSVTTSRNRLNSTVEAMRIA